VPARSISFFGYQPFLPVFGTNVKYQYLSHPETPLLSHCCILILLCYHTIHRHHSHQSSYLLFYPDFPPCQNSTHSHIPYPFSCCGPVWVLPFGADTNGRIYLHRLRLKIIQSLYIYDVITNCERRVQCMHISASPSRLDTPF